MTSSETRPRIYTIGHSTRTLDDFVALLHAHGVRQLVDIRTIPRSRRHPQFDRETLAAELPARNIGYRHMPGLGGLRHPRRDSPNGGWRNDSFRGYADYMATPAFGQALDDLIAIAAIEPTCVMCAEAVWWRCHRNLVADALVSRGIAALHITSSGPPSPHQLNRMARIENGIVRYPSARDE